MTTLLVTLPRMFISYTDVRQRHMARYQSYLRCLHADFDVVAGDPVIHVKCHHCGKRYRLNQRYRQIAHVAHHEWLRKLDAKLIGATRCRIHINGTWRVVLITRIRRKRDGAYLVKQVKNHDRFKSPRSWFVKRIERLIPIENEPLAG